MGDARRWLIVAPHDLILPLVELGEVERPVVVWRSPLGLYPPVDPLKTQLVRLMKGRECELRAD